MGELALVRDYSTVPLIPISCNTVFSKSQNARMTGTLCTFSRGQGTHSAKKVLIVWLRIAQMPQKILAQFVCPSPKVNHFWKNNSLWVSVVRGHIDQTRCRSRTGNWFIAYCLPCLLLCGGGARARARACQTKANSSCYGSSIGPFLCCIFLIWLELRSSQRPLLPSNLI